MSKNKADLPLHKRKILNEDEFSRGYASILQLKASFRLLGYLLLHGTNARDWKVISGIANKTCLFFADFAMRKLIELYGYRGQEPHIIMETLEKNSPVNWVIFEKKSIHSSGQRAEKSPLKLMSNTHV